MQSMRQPKQVPLLLSFFLVVLTLFLSACGGTNSSQTNNSGVTHGGSLTIVPAPYGDFTRNFNVFLNSSQLNGTQGMIYETLLYFNRESGDVNPWLATSYQFSADAKSLTFTLRDGVKWNDGQPLTSDDVAFSFNILHQFPALDSNVIWQAIDKVTNPDPKTVVVTFKQPSTDMLWYTGGQTYIVPKHIWQSVSDPIKYTNENPVGTGPFMLKSFTPQLYVLGRNPNFWQPGKPYIDELRYPSFNSGASADLVLSQGSLDWSGLYTPSIQKTYVNSDPDHHHYWFPAWNDVMLYINLKRSPFDQLAVRQAISLSIDRDKLYKIGETGYEPVAHPTGLVLPANEKFLSSEFKDMSFKMDVAKASSLLQQAGFTKGGDGILVGKDGKRLSFKINVVTGWSDWVTDCQIMSENLKAIGIDLTVNAISYSSYYSGLQSGDYDMAISWTNPGPTPYFLYNSLLNSSNTAAIGQNATSNFERWSDPTTDQLLNTYRSSPDKDKEQEALNGIQKIMVEQLPTIPLVYGATWYEYSTARFTGWPDEKNPYAVPAPWSYPDNEQVALHLHKI